MLNWLRRKPSAIDKARLVVEAVTNVATSALSWKDIYSAIKMERNYNTLNKGLSISAVYCALNLYASSVSTLPRNVMRVDTTTGDTTRKVLSSEGLHPAVRIFLHYANRSFSADDMFTIISNDLLVDGNFYALREYDSQGRTFNIYYIHPSRIPRGNIFYATGKEEYTDGTRAAQGTLVYRIETGNSVSTDKPKALLVKRDDIVHIKGPIVDPEYNRSSGIIENAYRTFKFAENTEEYGNKFYEKGTNSQTFLSTDQALGAPVIRELEAFFLNNPNAPLEDAFRTRILDRGMKPVNVTIPLGQLQFIETKAFSVEDIARWFAIPPELLHSRMGTTTGGDMPEIVNNFIQWGIGPFLTRIGNQLRDELLPLSSSLSYSFEFERIYLYRTLLNDLSQAVRNLFEIGVLNRMQIGKLIGVYVDPKDKQSKQLYVPTNLMTVQHGLALAKKAETANELIAEQVTAARLANENYTSPKEMMELKNKQDATKPTGESTKDDSDESPDQHNEDKKIRTAKNAFNATIIGLEEHRQRVYNQKAEKLSGEELHADYVKWVEDKFNPLIDRTLNSQGWSNFLSEVSSMATVEEVKNDWTRLVVQVTSDTKLGTV